MLLAIPADKEPSLPNRSKRLAGTEMGRAAPSLCLLLIDVR
jgi:hypothetical protein